MRIHCNRCGYEFTARKQQTTKKRQCPSCYSYDLTEMAATILPAMQYLGSTVENDIERDPDIVKLKKELMMEKLKQELKNYRAPTEEEWQQKERIEILEQKCTDLRAEIADTKMEMLAIIDKKILEMGKRIVDHIPLNRDLLMEFECQKCKHTGIGIQVACAHCGETYICCLSELYLKNILTLGE